MDEEILQKLKEHDEKLAAIYRSSEKTRKYFLWALVVSLFMFVVPLLGLLFIIPWFLQTISGGLLF